MVMYNYDYASHENLVLKEMFGKTWSTKTTFRDLISFWTKNTTFSITVQDYQTIKFLLHKT